MIPEACAQEVPPELPLLRTACVLFGATSRNVSAAPLPGGACGVMWHDDLAMFSVRCTAMCRDQYPPFGGCLSSGVDASAFLRGTTNLFCFLVSKVL